MIKYFKKSAIILSLILISQFSFGQTTVKDGTMTFSFDLYSKLRTENKNGNLFFSPMSISTAFTLPYAGATGLTKEQIETTFYYDDNAKKNLKSYRDFTANLERSKDVTLRIANGMWLEETMPIHKEFVKTAKQLTGKDEIHQVSFTKNYKASTSQINQWIANQTGGNIKNLLEEGSTNELTRFIIANAIYFQGNWASPFDNKLTATNNFYGFNDKKIETQFMTKPVTDHKYAENDDFQILELPYAGESTSMVIILPRFADGLAKIENNLSANNYKLWLSTMTKRPVVVTLPKFQLKIQYNLRATFRKMGLKEPFMDAASFDNISPQNLRLSNVFHQAFIIVSEQGTEATAATAIVGGVKGLKPKPAFFNANQPFLFFIKDNKTDMILFMGRMTEPENNAAVTYTTDIQPKRFPEIPTPKTDKIHWVEKGESLYSISKKYGVAVEQIKLLNKMTENNVKVGQELLIQEGETKGIETNNANLNTVMNSIHEVNPGETLFSIAKKYNLTLEELKALNGINENKVSLGQKLIVRATEKTKTVAPTPLPKPTIATTIQKPQTSLKQDKYIVQEGDTLWKISKKFNIPVEKIKTLNKLKSEVLEVGQQLTLK
jgi:serpin B